MPMYKYRAKKGPLEVIDGTLEAASEKEAVERVSQLGLLPLRVEESARLAEAEKKSVLVEPLGGKIRAREITIFSRQLASLLRSGVPILSSLNIIAEQSDNTRLKTVLRTVSNSVKDGSTFSSSLSQYPNVFSSLYVAMVRTGENSGVLSEVLLRIAEHRAKQEETLSRFRMALAYPILMIVVGIGTIVFMLTYVMPRLMNIFINLGQNLPLPTRIMIGVSRALSNWWLWVGLGLFIVVARRQAKTEAAKVVVGRLSLRVPLFGSFVLKNELSRFCRTLELLLKSGIPILKSIEVAVPVVNNEVIRSKLRDSHKELEQGGSFGKSLKASKVFPLFMTNLLIVGEESGRLTEALAEVAATYERDTDETIKVMTNLLEPLLILVMGLIVGFIVVAMLLPIFEINMMAR